MYTERCGLDLIHLFRSLLIDHRYSAPELLGGKHYGKSVDVWSIGICVYALMTGNLPFGNPESLTELHALILDGAYELPEFMTEPLKELFKRIFVIKPQNRITLEEIRQHEWLKGVPPTEWTHICNKKLPLAEVNRDIVSAIADLGMGDEPSVIKSVLKNHCNPASATYHLMLHKKHRMATQVEDGKAAELARRERAEADRVDGRTQTGVGGCAGAAACRRRRAADVPPPRSPPQAVAPRVEQGSKWTQEQEFTPRRSSTHSVGSGPTLTAFPRPTLPIRMRQSNKHGVGGAWRGTSGGPCGQHRNSFAIRKVSAVRTLPALSPEAQGSGKRSFDIRRTTRRGRKMKRGTSLPNLHLDACREQDADTALKRRRAHRKRQKQTVASLTPTMDVCDVGASSVPCSAGQDRPSRPTIPHGTHWDGNTSTDAGEFLAVGNEIGPVQPLAPSPWPLRYDDHNASKSSGGDAVAAVTMPPRSSSKGQEARRMPLRKLNILSHGPSDTLVFQSEKRNRKKVRGLAWCMMEESVCGLCLVHCSAGLRTALPAKRQLVPTPTPMIVPTLTPTPTLEQKPPPA